ncbi:methyltransferase family protein [Anditalea andensis]|uniref:Protein-S-isoprenylcysteine methyltransferase n=1 Tax=Anditalea andensis TaxID=1048983 RepID=A0A074KT09_9BACT|nr:isoprenylcysteine carboxylmethyltransferase family protein [Anditalea andensis]KEO72049.1 protein-S-isoprenylcysteine methyltransferase [Anditalea andensis]
MSYILLLMSWALFYFIHSVLASLKIKRNIHRYMGKGYKWYRFFYALISLSLFVIIFFYGATIPTVILFPTGDFGEYMALMLSGIGTIILIKAFKFFGPLRFLGLPLHNDLHEPQELIVQGIHRYLRHPVYLALIFIYLGFFLYMPTTVSLVHLVALIIYIPIGIYFEERKLITIFGPAYEDYKKEVPSLLPKFTR